MSRPDPRFHFDVLEAMQDMGDGTIRESWVRCYRDYECDLWYVFRPADPPANGAGCVPALS